jgi:hypothetical protein
MKILIVFIDMLRPNMMNSFNPKVKRFELDDELEKIGGTIYNNCFTPSPDTPRSLACFWSGLNPHINGCDKRIKYPKFYLDSRNENMLQLLKNKNYSFNFFININKRRSGVLPDGFEDIGYHNEDLNLEKYLSGIKLEDDSFTFIDLSDFHYTNDDYSHNFLATKKGYERVSSSLKIVQDKINIDNIDLSLIFSDHGHKFDVDIKNQPKYRILDADRTNILMQLRLKNDRGLNFNDKFCSITDFYPTLLELLKVEEKISITGKSLLSNEEIEYIVAEDHFKFLPEINQDLNVWAVIIKDGFYFRTLDNYYYINQENFNKSKEELDLIIEKHSSYFAEYKKEYQVLMYYRDMKKEKGNHTDGTKRFEMNRNKLYLLAYRIINKLILQKRSSIIFKNK